MKVELKKNDFAKFYAFDKIHKIDIVVSTVGGRCRFYGYSDAGRNYTKLVLDYGEYDDGEETIYLEDFLKNLQDGLYTITKDSYVVGVTSYTNIKHLDDEEMADIIKEPEPLKVENEIMIDKKLLDLLKIIKKTAGIGMNSNVVLIDLHRISFNDSASVVYYETETQVKKDGFLLPLNIVNLVDADTSLFAEKIGKDAVLFSYQKDNLTVFYSTILNFSLPTQKELQTFLPESDRQTLVSIETKDFMSTLGKFNSRENFKWGQIYFTFFLNQPTALLLDFKKYAVEISDAVLCELQSNTEKDNVTDFWLPTKYIKSLAPLFSETCTMAFNNIGPRIPHGQAIQIKSGDLTLILCKLIMTP
jgi:hypothetical protein